MSQPIVIVYLGPDAVDSAVQRRVRALRGGGARVHAFAFLRTQGGASPAVSDIEMLGAAVDGRLGGRILSLIRAILVLWANRNILRGADIIYCRNLDLGVLAVVVGKILRLRAAVAYEVLDIHPLLYRRGIIGRSMRWVERRVLAHCRLLVVSSHRFLTDYFGQLQGYCGASHLVENKLEAHLATSHDVKSSVDGPIVIGYVGKLRCARSLELLSHIARKFQGRVQVRIAGVPLSGVEDALQGLLRLPNIEYLGRYEYPDGVPTVYRGMHLSWGLDLSDPFNSRLLLPNRVYEASACGVPTIAVRGTATGDFVAERGLGVVMESSNEDDLDALMSSLTSEDLEAMSQRVAAQSANAFVESHEDVERLLTALLECSNSR